jgi:protein gp37
MENSHIEWTNHTFNPWWGCMKVSEGCKNCYAEKLDNRYNHYDPHWGPNSPRKPMSKEYWKNPYKWDKAAAASGVKAKVFCASMADVFEDHSDVRQWRNELFYVILNTPNLVWQLLTKRPENITKLVPALWLNNWPENVWIGTSVENQQVADERILRLLEVPAKTHFLSCEPLLSNLDIAKWLKPIVCTYTDGSGQGYTMKPIDWVICGGESGPNARPMHPDWARSLRDQCAAADVAFFFKQWGEWIDLDHAMAVGIESLSISVSKSRLVLENDSLKTKGLYKFGKRATGSLLDCLEYKQFPA